MTVEDDTQRDDEALQLEVEAEGDKSIFTRINDPFKPEQVVEILRLVKIGPDLTEDERMQVTEMISKFADCFALSVREVIAIPGAEHRINIPLDAVFPTKVPHQKPLTDNQCTYLNNAINELIAADIIEMIHPEDVKCCSPITLAQKTHDKLCLSLNELKHRVNEECIAHGMTPAHNIETKNAPTPAAQSTPHNLTPMRHTPPKPQTWRICQNYAVLNKVTQVFPTPGGDICTNQCKLSGHWCVHKFNFASGFYTVHVPAPMRPFLAFYTKGRGFLTGSPSTFHTVTSENLGDLLPKIRMELIVNDSRIVGNEFNDMMERTWLFLEHVRDKSMSITAKKSELFMSEIVFAGSRVSINRVLPDTAKLTAIVDWHQPPDLLNLSSFLGLAGYFRDLIKGYMRIAQPVTDLICNTPIPKGAGKTTY